MKISKKKQFLAAACALACAAAFSGTAMAAALLVDRGLPTDNLNNVAGANRANVAWAFVQPRTAVDGWFWGDTFQNTSAQAWNINTIRLWTTGQTDTAVLLGGLDGGSVGVVSGAGVISAPVPYANSASYETSTAGVYREIHQVDFAVNITLLAGQTYDFFLDGTGGPAGTAGIPFLHASNKNLSGSAQQGADNSMLALYAPGWDPSALGAGTETTDTNGWGWDKSSDVNVQVFGEVPEPASLALVGLALFGAGAARRFAQR